MLSVINWNFQMEMECWKTYIYHSMAAPQYFEIFRMRLLVGHMHEYNLFTLYGIYIV